MKVKVLIQVLALLACLMMLSAPNVLAGPLAALPCNGNFDYDLDVDAEDVTEFLVHFGRNAYNDPCPESPCPVTCEGTLSTLGRWCDQGDGTVKDMTTGLVWLKKADWGGDYPFWAEYYSDTDAHDRAIQLWDGSPYEGTAGLADGSVEGNWRLPTKTELMRITVGDEYISSDQMYFFTDVQSFYYWSSTSNAIDPFRAWAVSMINGVLASLPPDTILFVWPVRNP